MGQVNRIEGVLLNREKMISVEGGDILHVIKKSSAGFKAFGEAYFSCINFQAVKAWKQHRKMTLNLVVPSGSVKFVLFDDRPGSRTRGRINEFILSPENYFRLTVPPMVWNGFQGLAQGLNLILNLADIEHDPQECDRMDLDNSIIDYRW